jgi:hypothetical protein
MHTTATAIPPAIDEGCAAPEQAEVLETIPAHVAWYRRHAKHKPGHALRGLIELTCVGAALWYWLH